MRAGGLDRFLWRLVFALAVYVRAIRCGVAFRQLILLSLLGLSLLRRHKLPNSLLFQSSLFAAHFGVRIRLGQQIAITLQKPRWSDAESNVICQPKEKLCVG